ncbi:MAG: DNA adenine methylase [Paludibacter sp.]|jgi:methylase of polypeptide subunit release factors|nr:DNA adenine methylase [Paludibacter sp.]
MNNDEFDVKNWKETNILTDSLWLINERDKSGKHANVYHGNFVPQIPNQLILRYTKAGETVLDLFMGSGTTLFECENLKRNFIGFDINQQIIDFVNSKMIDTQDINFEINNCDVTNKEKFDSAIKNQKVQFLIAHPPYMDIVKFTDLQEDLSHISDLKLFLDKFTQAIGNGLQYLEKNRYFAVVIGDVYKKSEVVPLGFYVNYAIKKKFNVKLKGIVVKNIEGNRGKIGVNNIWKYRALKSDYYIFKHEYIFVFKKEF